MKNLNDEKGEWQEGWDDDGLSFGRCFAVVVFAIVVAIAYEH